MKICVVGAAGHVGYVTEGLGEMEDVVLCGVAPGCPEEDESRVRRLGGDSATFHSDYRAMLERERPDIVAVAPFYYLHAEVSCAALEAGCAVYCEKPLALTLEDLDRVRTAQAESSRPLGMMLATRYAPTFHAARKLVAAGAIGTPTVGYAQKSYKRGNRPEFYRLRKTFGGITPWVGIHAVDWLRWVSGVEYSAVRSQHVKLHRPDYPEMEDGATCLYELANGGTAVMSFDFLRPAGASSHGDDRLRLMGEKGALEIREDCGLQLITEAGTEQVSLVTPPLGPFADFATSVRDASHRCVISTEDALRVTEIALCSRQAADTGLRVELA
ncbi:MAG: Gfo/Idh/MocA family oxidoreductase [Lentisphaeria bacterium]|nr:Gfo/Idh/MocA family oxidoreductase [Lentisphaeria bacterium]